MFRLWLLTLFSSFSLFLLAAPQEIIFEENFNSQSSFGNWSIIIGGQDQANAPTWHWDSYSGVNFSGAALIYNGEGSSTTYCPSTEKTLLSPIVNVGEAREILLVFSVNFEGPAEASNKLSLVAYNRRSKTETQEITIDPELHLVSKVGSWFVFNVAIDRGSSAPEYPFFQIGFKYFSPEGAVCGDTITIDDISLEAEVVHENTPPQTTISQPALVRLEVRRGETIQFTGGGFDPDGDAITYWWRFCNQGDLCKVEGKDQSFTFQEYGVYEVVCWATDSKGAPDPTPDRRYIRVVDNLIPHFTSTSVTDAFGQTVQFRDGLALINAGDTLKFQAKAADRDSQDQIRLTWHRSPTNEVTTGVPSVSYEFPEPGNYVVGCTILDREGGKNYIVWKIRVLSDGQNIPPLARIVSPANYSQILRGVPFDICGEVIDPDTNFGSCTGATSANLNAKDGVGRVFWSLNNGLTIEGIGAPDITIHREGNYQLTMQASDGEFVDRKTHHFAIIDRDFLEKPSITYPTQTVRIQPGERIYFEGTVRSSSIVKKFFIWTIKALNASGETHSIRQTTLGEYVFEEPGRYEVTLTAVHPSNEALSKVSDVREIWVEAIPIITGNTSPETAAELPTGFYQANQVGDARFFKVILTERGQNLRLHLEYEGTAEISIFNSDHQLLGSQRFSQETSFQLRSLPADTYIVKFDPDKSKQSGKAKDLTFGMGVNVTNAGLYFPDVELTTNFDTSIGLLNPFPQEVDVELLAYDKNGGLLAQAPIRLSAMGRYAASIESLFPTSFKNVAWVRADSAGSISGYSFTKSHDGHESYAMHAAEKLSKDLFVPHIAQRTEQWYTIARVINGSPETADASIVAGNESAKLKNNQKFSKDDFNMLDKFNGNLPQTEWGVFVEKTSQIRLAGVEIFGKVDGNRQTAGLLLDDNGHDNPNFTFVRNDIYFTHIARSTAQFWTGLAFVNTEDHEATFKLIAYGDGGTKVGEKNFRLAAGEKIVDVAENILEGIGSPSTVDWVKVQADEGIVGYELFGTHDNKRLAGLEGINGLKKDICFPYLDTTRETWHGISVVNVSEAKCNLTFRLMSDAGVVLLETQKSLLGNEKLVMLVTDLFGIQHLPTNAGWVACEGDQLLAGFELFGDFAGNTMAAVIAR